jgi:hypothetical protein
MDKDKTFSELMEKPDLFEQDEVWVKVMEVAKFFEEEKGFSRQTVFEATLDAALGLAMKRPDQQLMQHMNDTRRMYMHAAEVATRRFDQFACYSTQREAERMYGKDLLYLRNAKNFGWEPPITEE